MVLDVSTTLHGKRGGKLGGPPSKARVLPATHRAEYREGTVKRTPARGVKERLKPGARGRSEGDLGP